MRRVPPRQIGIGRLQRGDEIDAGGLDGGAEAEEDGAQERHRHAEDERALVQLQERHRDHFGRKLDLPQQHDADVSHGQAADAAGEGDAQALGDELAHQPRAARTDRHPQRDLAGPDGRAAREQTRHVRARHAQHRKRQRRQHDHQPGVERAALEADLELGLRHESLLVVRLGIRLLERPADGGELSLGGRERHARTSGALSPSGCGSRAPSADRRAGS